MNKTLLAISALRKKDQTAVSLSRELGISVVCARAMIYSTLLKKGIVKKGDKVTNKATGFMLTTYKFTGYDPVSCKINDKCEKPTLINITEFQKAELKRIYGNVSKGVRELINAKLEFENDAKQFGIEMAKIARNLPDVEVKDITDLSMMEVIK